MTKALDPREFLSAYLAEVDEHLQVANARLLEIDAAARKGEAQPRAVRDLFRALHTIKGLSAMVGVEPAVAISHRMETCLRAADRSGGKVASESVDVLLEGVRAIEHRVRELAEKKEPTSTPAALLEALDRIAEIAPTPSGGEVAALDLAPAIASKLAPFELDLLREGAKRGLRAMRGDFSPSPAKAERGLSINTVRERLGSIAEIVKAVPVAVRPSDDAPGALTFALLFLTSASDEDVAAAIGVRPAELQPLTGTQPSSLSVAPLLPEHDHEDEGAGFHLRNVVRVEVGRLDDAMEHLSTLIVTRARLVRAIGKLTAAGTDTRDLVEIMRDNARQLRDLRAAILRVRMVPVGEVLERIPLLLRGLRREKGKAIRVLVDVGDAELDKGVAERLFPAIVHLVRNAVDHAIESPEHRLRLGKPEEGTLRIGAVTRSSSRLELTVTDDGRGVDRTAVARRIGREIPPNDSALLAALCRPGLSTRDEVTTTSGRGLGMDIVRRIVVDQLGGQLQMTTEVGVGTTFTLSVPLTITIVDAFTMECRGHVFAVPLSSVEEIFEVDHGKVRHGPAPKSDGPPFGMIEWRGEAVPLFDLAPALGLEARGLDARKALLVRHGGEPMAFALDRVIGQQEAVVRPLIDPLLQVPGVAGATDLGDGKPTLMLDLASLGASLFRPDGERAA